MQSTLLEQNWPEQQLTYMQTNIRRDILEPGIMVETNSSTNQRDCVNPEHCRPLD
jgi:hypothetical protein